MVHYLNVFFGVLDFLMLKKLWLKKNLASEKLMIRIFLKGLNVHQLYI